MRRFKLYITESASTYETYYITQWCRYLLAPDYVELLSGQPKKAAVHQTFLVYAWNVHGHGQSIGKNKFDIVGAQRGWMKGG